MTVATVVAASWPVFSQAPEAVVAQVAQAAQLRLLRRRQVALSPAEVGDALGWVVSGRVQALGQTVDGKEFVVGSFGPGEFFGEVEAFGGAAPGTVYAAAMEGAVAVVPLAALEQAGEAWPALWRRLLAATAARSGQWLAWRRRLSLPNAVERVEETLAWLAGLDESGLGRLPEGVTQQEIAGYANTTRETVTRVMQRLQQEGRVVREEGGWRVAGLRR